MDNESIAQLACSCGSRAGLVFITKEGRNQCGDCVQKVYARVASNEAMKPATEWLAELGESFGEPIDAETGLAILVLVTAIQRDAVVSVDLKTISEIVDALQNATHALQELTQAAKRQAGQETEKYVVTLEFSSEKMRKAFWGHFLDGGGDDAVIEGLSMNGFEVTHDWDGVTKTIRFAHLKFPV